MHGHKNLIAGALFVMALLPTVGGTGLDEYKGSGC
jgi:hypothetical protein